MRFKCKESEMKFNCILVFLTVILLSFEVEAQINIKTYTSATDTFYWKRYTHIPKPAKINLKQFTVSRSGKIIESFLLKHLDQFPQFTDDSVPRFSPKDLKKCLYPLDINGDNLPDMIFSGYSGGESDIVKIYLNRTDSFELVFEDYQYITKFTCGHGLLTEMQTGDAGCCDNYLYFTRDYSVKLENGKPLFVKGKQQVVYKYTEEPDICYPRGIPFAMKSDTMLVRASAAQLNEPFNPHLETFGNIIAKYRTRAKGIALAYKSYGKGNDWYFVEIFPDAAPSASILYDVEKMPTFIRGWVSGQAILLGPE
ncbi:MAG: hypothetical protein WCK84_08290 [Bacteroidota bacterium]